MNAVMFYASVNVRSLSAALPIAMAIVLGGTASRASDLSEIKSKGGRQLSQTQIAKMYIGRKIRAQSLDGKLKYTIQYNKDGSKVTKVGGKTLVRSWTYKNGKWCETLNNVDQRICDPIIYRLGTACYGFKPDGKAVGKWNC